MELEFLPFSLSFLGLLLLFFFLLMVWKTLSKTSKISGKLPPGPRKLPFIGNIHNLFGGLPHIVLRDLAKKYGPLMHLQLGEVSTVIVSSAEMAKEVLVTHDPVFANRPDRLAINIMWYDKQDMIFTPYGDHWRQLRKICTMELLSNTNVRSFSYIRMDEIMKLMKSIRSSLGVPVNVTAIFFRFPTFLLSSVPFFSLSKSL